MELCPYLSVGLSGAAGLVMALWSLLLDKFPGLRGWWADRSEGEHLLILGASVIVIGGGAWAVGYWLIPCPTWPTLASAIIILVGAIAGLFQGVGRHEAAKRNLAESKLAVAEAKLAQAKWK